MSRTTQDSLAAWEELSLWFVSNAPFGEVKC
jgi:hypothetical protein